MEHEGSSEVVNRLSRLENSQENIIILENKIRAFLPTIMGLNNLR